MFPAPPRGTTLAPDADVARIITAAASENRNDYARDRACRTEEFAATPRNNPDTPAGAHASSEPLHVLVVDDEALLSWSLGQALTDCGDVVLHASNGAAALRTLAADDAPPDVVMLDYWLPDSHDFRLLEALHRLSPASHVILMSANLTMEMAREALERGASCVLHKPIDMCQIAAVVRWVVATPDIR
jgi:CheY-like chemotaxis protein